MFKLKASRLSILLILTASLARTQTVTARSGNGSIGGTDGAITFLLGPPSGDFGHTFTADDFSSAQTGPAAFIVDPNPLWMSSLTADESAKWIGTNADAGCCAGNTALYAVSFEITNAFTSATLELFYAVDDAIGDTVINNGPNTGIYLNGSAACGGAFAIGFSEQHWVSCDVSSLMRVGTNWLYIEDGNVEGSAGLLFSATIIAINLSGAGLLVNVPGTAMPWLYSTASGGLNSTYQYGLNDGSNPVIVSSSNGINFSAGSKLTVTYLNGAVSVGPDIALPYTDANGFPGDTFANVPVELPGHYMNPVGYVSELVGTFTDNGGSIIGTPFALGDGPTTLTVPVGATQLQFGVDDDQYYNNAGSWVIQLSGSLVKSVPSIDGVGNSAVYSAGTPVAPGSIATAKGSFLLSSPSIAPSSQPWPTSLGGLSMQFAGVKTPLDYVSAAQVNFQVPWELEGSTQAPLTATVGSQTSAAQTVNVPRFSPGLYSMNAEGNGQGAILDSKYRLVDSSNPASVGDVIQIYCTGLGAVTNQPASGFPAPFKPLAETAARPNVAIDGVSAQVLYSGLTPGAVGLYQINAQIPNGIETGTSVQVAVTIGGIASNTVTVAIQPFPVAANPQPAITSLSPASAQAGSGPLTLSISGSGFIPSSSVTFNAAPHTASFVSSGQLTIALSTSELATAGGFPVVVTNPPPGGGSSNTADFNVSPASVPVPAPPTGLSPGSTTPPGVTVSTLTPTLSWNSSPGATGYVVVILNSETGAEILAQKISTTSFICPALVSGMNYGWSVASYNSGGLGTAATPVYFTVATVHTGSLTGSWQGEWGSIPDPSAFGSLSATLTQNGSAVTGTIRLPSSSCVPGGDVSGTISGNTLTLNLLVGPPQPMAIFSGTLDASSNSILGVYEVYLGACTGDYGLFTAQRSN